jgi:hypothetical protein
MGFLIFVSLEISQKAAIFLDAYVDISCQVNLLLDLDKIVFESRGNDNSMVLDMVLLGNGLAILNALLNDR